MKNDSSLVMHKMHAPQTADDIKSQVDLIQKVMNKIMVKDTHYGVIPGTKKNTLYKAGAEVLLTTFRLSVQPDVEDLSTSDEIRYRVHARGVHMGTQVVVGIGVGECSSSEEKYKWRAAVCPEEFDYFEENRRRMKFKRGYNGGPSEQIQQVRTDPADSANTILKMAKKRAEVDLCLTALAASDVFAQDLEDMPESFREQQPSGPKSNSQAPRSNSQSGGNGWASDAQIRMLKAKSNGAPFTIEQLCTAFEVPIIEQMPFARVNEALKWIENGGQF